MADFHLQPDPTRSTTDSRRRLLTGVSQPPLAPPTLEPGGEGDRNLDLTMPWDADDALRLEMQRLEASMSAKGGADGFADLAAATFPDVEELRSRSGVHRDVSRSTPLPGDLPGLGDLHAADPAELDRLRSENEELHRVIEEMKQIFEQASLQEQEYLQAVQQLEQQGQAVQAQLQERDEQVRMLSGQIAELEQHITESEHASPPPPPSEDELSRLADELEQEQAKLLRERKELEQERHQMREDETTMMTQMREMEVSMAKERAEMARQRTELQRLHAEIRHELDTLQRSDGALASRMAQFQRRHQEVFARPTPGAPAAAPLLPPPTAAHPPHAPVPTSAKRQSTLKKLFGK